MAEIIVEPSALSKIIPISFKINDTDSITTTRLATKKQFNTTDTDAWLSFKLDGIDANMTGDFDLTMVNVDENPSSIINRTNLPFSAIPFHYKIDASADVEKNQIRHAGRWIGQVIIRLVNGDTTTRQFDFAIVGHLLDGKEARLILIEDYNALMATMTTSKDELAQYNIDYAALIETVTTQEAARVQAELTRAQTFDALVESEMIAQNVATKLTEKEATFAPRVLSVEQQLEQADVRMDGIVTSAGNYYVKCLPTDTGALLVVASGATTGQINLSSVSPKLDTYTPIVGDYVTLVSNGLTAETTDIRIGADGVTYGSAGSAVRKQFSAVEEVFSNMWELSSKNKILLKDKVYGPINGITMTVKNGVITINGTATSQFDTNLLLTANLNISTSMRFTLYTALTNTKFIIGVNEGPAINTLPWSLTGYARTISTPINIYQLVIRIYSGATFANDVIHPQIETGTVSTTYEPPFAHTIPAYYKQNDAFNYRYLIDEVVCLGDSLTQGYIKAGYTHTKTSYPVVMAKLIGGKTYNKGSSGYTALQLYNQIVANYGTWYDFSNKKFAIIWLGTNAGLDSVEQQTAYVNIINLIKQYSPNCKIFLCTIFSGGGTNGITPTNNYIKSLNYPVIDMNVAPFKYLHDYALHPIDNHFSDLGNVKIAEYVVNTICDNIKANPASYLYIGGSIDA